MKRRSLFQMLMGLFVAPKLPAHHYGASRIQQLSQ